MANEIYSGPKRVCDHCHRAFTSGQEVMVERGEHGRVFCYVFGSRGCSDKYMAAHLGDRLAPLDALCMPAELPAES